MKKCKTCQRCEVERSWQLKNGTVVEIGQNLGNHKFGIKLPRGTLSWALCNEFNWKAGKPQ